jgi:signal transduction histidine kinase/ligand-binding sensor domain-containing protein
MISLNPGYRLSCSTFILFCLILTKVNSAFSQGEKINFDHITIPGVIRSAQISDIIQDGDGIIWIVGNGLYRYDGFKFTLYKDVEDSDVKLNGKEISTIYYDSVQNRVLVATRNFGLMQYNYASNKITALPKQNDLPVINQLTRTSDGRLWGASINNGIFYGEGDTLKRVHYLPNRWPSCILADNEKLYVGQLATIFVIKDDVIADTIDLAASFKQLPAYTRISALFRDRLNQLWIGTEKQGLFVYDIATNKFKRHFAPIQAPFFSRITRIHEDNAGLIWILTKADGLAVYNQVNDHLTHLFYNPGSATSISGNNCFSLLEDSNGIIWVGAIGDLNKYDRRKINFRHIRNNPLEPASLNDNMVRGVYEDARGTIWIGTDGGFINLYDRAKNSIEYIKVKLPGEELNYVPMYFCERNERTMLVASSLGLLQFDRVTKKFSPFTPLWEITKNKMVRQVILENGVLYILFSGNILTYNLSSGEIKKYGRFGEPRAFNASVMHFNQHKRLWVGVRDGVSYFDSTRNDFIFIPFERKTNRSDSVLTMVLSLQEFNDKIYAGTFNHGLWVIDIQQPDSSKNYTETDGLQNNTIYATLPDSTGNLWVATNGGVVKFDPVTKKAIPFTVSEGLQDEEFNRLAYSVNKNGEMILGGINGINIFHPKDIAIVDNHTAPVITSLVVSDPYTEDYQTTFVKASDNLSLSSDQNHITFNFTVPNYHEPRRFSIYYKLEGVDQQWREVQSDNSASYGNLKPGDYIFAVKAVSLAGDEIKTELAFVITPPLWRTWWFMLLSFVAVAFLVMTIIRSYVRRAQFDKQRLEDLLKIRTREIEHSREELRALNQKKDLIFSILSHDLRSPLTTLKGFLGILIDNSDFLSKDDIKKHAVNIRNSVTNSLDLIDNTLFWSLSQMGNIQYSPSAFQLKPVVEKVIGLYHLTAEKKMIRVSLKCEENIQVHADENMIYVTLRNIVSNAIKFTREGKAVSINCSLNHIYARIEIKDEGIGMSGEYLNKILSMEQPMIKKGTSNEKGTGLGLLLCKNFLEVNKGKLQITSEENIGTTFIVYLPVVNPTT